MRTLRCTVCGHVWDCNIARPTCPNCLVNYWASVPRMITPEHDSRCLPSASSKFRSVLPGDYPDRQTEYNTYFAHSGTALYSHRHSDVCYVCGSAPSLNAGSAIPVGSAMPVYAFDAFLVAQYYWSKAHVYAEDNSKIQVQLQSGTLTFLPICSVDGCELRSVPGSGFCVLHHDPPLAAEVTDEGREGTVTNS